MDEYIDIVTSNGNPTGQKVLKSEAHRKGLYHNTVHLWLFTKQGEVLLQQRSHKKLIHPLLWDVSVAGHIDAGESFEEAAVRECMEEIGLEIAPKQLIYLGSKLHKTEYRENEIKDYEFHQIYISEFKTDIKQFKIDGEEVEAVKLVDLDHFEVLLRDSNNNHHFIATNSAYYRFVIQEIKKQLAK